MRVLVEDESGERATTVDVKSTDDLKMLRTKIRDATGVAVDQQRLSFNNRQMRQVTKTMENYNIKDGSKVSLVVIPAAVALSGKRVKDFEDVVARRKRDKLSKEQKDRTTTQDNLSSPWAAPPATIGHRQVSLVSRAKCIQ